MEVKEILSSTVKEQLKALTLPFISEEVRQASKQFMDDNGFAITPEGKAQAITELEVSEHIQETYPKDLISAVAMGIAIL